MACVTYYIHGLVFMLRNGTIDVYRERDGRLVYTVFLGTFDLSMNRFEFLDWCHDFISGL